MYYQATLGLREAPTIGGQRLIPPFPLSRTALGPSPALMGLKPSGPSPIGLFQLFSIPPHHQAMPSLDTRQTLTQEKWIMASLALPRLPLLIKPEQPPYALFPQCREPGSEG